MFQRFRKQKRKFGAGCSDCSSETQGVRGSDQILTQVGNGCRCRIRRHRAVGAIRQRLLDLGFVPNAEVEMIRCATLGDPLEMRVGDYYVTLRKREADLIDVKTA
ncbi:ferrous iron transport protein A [Desulfonatronum thiosulfatophilum]|uniref:Ferrous iron transport protein A n=1 Tax=Desulfonatronum thiosulfatophilum TaxID=617002 RepID=A0A1G6D8L5_9BACT|nr:ferrous iron transport protein A [Desulfonatronum thiosulfatophilum]SDB41399.1 ferrous iron transport protein A [Desulfonatronum thiosulfatophilum]